MDEVKPVTNDNKWQLVSQLGLFQKVLDAFCIVAVGFSTDTLHFFDLSSLTGSLDVLEVHLRILAEVDN